ncbi:MAG: DedA family protein [Cytophagales bacterium]|nr:DedA family protein [Cytophagales bacterium]
MSISEFITNLTNSQEIIRTGGLVLITAIVFAENGLFFGFFLPGDYLLFSAGLLCGTGDFDVPIAVLATCIWCAATLGSYVGYLSGKFIGGRLLNAKDTWYFKREYIVKTRYYYIKYAGNTLLIGRFLPIVRTFAPILAGIIKMEFKRFIFYNLLGGTIWVLGLVLGGYFLGQRFPQLLHYIEYIVLAFIAVTSVVVLKGLMSARKKSPSANKS